MAFFVHLLAKGRVTEEFEAWVLDRLFLGRALQYYHCALWGKGYRTVAPGEGEAAIDRAAAEDFDLVPDASPAAFEPDLDLDLDIGL